MLTLTDMFCGAGGSSTGALEVPGIEVRTALNHWDRAIETLPSIPPKSASLWDNKNGPGGAGNTIRGLTRSLDHTEEGLWISLPAHAETVAPSSRSQTSPESKPGCTGASARSAAPSTSGSGARARRITCARTGRRIPCDAIPTTSASIASQTGKRCSPTKRATGRPIATKRPPGAMPAAHFQWMTKHANGCQSSAPIPAPTAGCRAERLTTSYPSRQAGRTSGKTSPEPACPATARSARAGCSGSSCAAPDLGTKRERVKLAGNAVTPPAARDLIGAVADALNGTWP